MDFPTPPFPLATPIIFFTVCIPVSASRDRPSITFAVTFMSKFLIPSIPPIAFLTSSSISALKGHAGVVNSRVNFRLPSLSSKSFIIPIETISLFKSGSITVLSFSRTWSMPTMYKKVPIHYLYIGQTTKEICNFLKNIQNHCCFEVRLPKDS